MTVPCVNSKYEGRMILQHGESRAGNGRPMAEVEEEVEDSTAELHLSGYAKNPDNWIFL
jgi:hypothetical protein